MGQWCRHHRDVGDSVSDRGVGVGVDSSRPEMRAGICILASFAGPRGARNSAGSGEWLVVGVLSIVAGSRSNCIVSVTDSVISPDTTGMVNFGGRRPSRDSMAWTSA